MNITSITLEREDSNWYLYQFYNKGNSSIEGFSEQYLHKLIIYDFYFK